MRTLVPGQTSEGDHRSRHNEEGSQVVKEEVALSHTNNLLSQHFKHIAEHLEKAPLTYTHRTESALKESADLAFHVDEGNGKHSIQSNNDQCHEDALCQDRAPLSKATSTH